MEQGLWNMYIWNIFTPGYNTFSLKLENKKIIFSTYMALWLSSKPIF